MYKIIQTQHEHGHVEAYVDCFVLGGVYGSLKYLSFFGGTASVKALAAQIISGYGKVRLLDDDKYVSYEDEPVEVKKGWEQLRLVTQNIKPGVTQKTLFAEDAFKPWKKKGVREFLTYGVNEAQAKKRAFQIIDKMSKVPLSAGWADWLWGLLTEGSGHSLPVMGGDVPEFNCGLFLPIPSDETLEQRIKEDLSYLRSL